MLLRSENKISLSDDDIDFFTSNNDGIKQVKEWINTELVSTTEHKGKLVQSDRAFMIFCRCIVYNDVSTGDEVYNSVVKSLYAVVEFHRLSNITIRRGGGKTFFACLYSIFKQYTLHHYSVLCAFNIPTMVESFFDLYREIIDNNEMLLDKKECRRPIWSNKGCIYNYGRIKGITLGSSARSKHPNLVIIDDLLGKTDGATKYTNEDVKKFVLSDLLPIADRKKARVILLGTIDNTEDIYHTTAYDSNNLFDRDKLLFTNNEMYISATGWCCVIFPAVINFDNKTVLLPEIYDYDSCMEDKKRMGDFLWYREMQQEIKIDKTALISEYIFNKCKNDTLSLIEQGEPGKKYLITVDPSSGEGEFSDYAAISVTETVGKQKIIRYLWQKRHLPIIDPNGNGEDLANHIKRVWIWFKRSPLFVENNSIGRVLIQELVRLGVDVEEHNTGSDKVDIFSKAISEFKLEITDKDGKPVPKIIIPSNPNDEYTLEMLEELKKQCLNYSRTENNGKVTMGGRGVHDDLITSLLINIHYATEENDSCAECVCID